VAGNKRCPASVILNPAHIIRDRLRDSTRYDGIYPVRDSWSRRKQGKGRGQPLSAGLPRKRAYSLALRFDWYVWVKLYTPTRLNLFEKPCPWLWTTWKPDSKIIENFNLIIKLGKLINVCLRMLPQGSRG
jgi:hypothetical protein